MKLVSAVLGIVISTTVFAGQSIEPTKSISSVWKTYQTKQLPKHEENDLHIVYGGEDFKPAKINPQYVA